MPANTTQTAYDFAGTSFDDTIAEGFTNADGAVIYETGQDPISVNGVEGDDLIITGEGNDLAAGDMVGNEWAYVDGQWVFDPSKLVVSAHGMADSFDDTITTGAGNDVLLGNGGNDTLSSGAGDDIVNAGRGNDRCLGGLGDDILNLEAGDDFAEAGLGDDTVNGGDGRDVIHGDLKAENILSSAGSDASTFHALTKAGSWTMVDSDGVSEISHSADTVAGETYTVSFELAANLSGGHSAARVEVLWNGLVVDIVETTSGAFETCSVEVQASADGGELGFRAVEATGTGDYDFDGPIVSYAAKKDIGGAPVTVSAFAPGQSNLYQVIDGQLNVFDVEARAYTAVGETPDFKINAAGFNAEDDLIYGVAKSGGTDSLGNTVRSSDIVMIDADGATYRIGDGFYGDYVGDFDGSGNLWTFESTINRISVVDVDRLDADGNPTITYYKFDADLFTDRTYDIAYNAADNTFVAVVAPGSNGGTGKVVVFDMSDVGSGGAPRFTEVPITSTLYGEDMVDGMARGAFGAVFFDGDGNLYYGLNSGDHDLDGATATQGAIFKVNVDWDAGLAFSEFMSEAQSTGSNDGAVDPRSTDAFAEVDADAAVLLRDPSLALVEGGNDKLRGGDGNDEIHGNGGNDEIHGGAGKDELFGDAGSDTISGGAGDDALSGGSGADKLRGEAGNDTISGDAGDDYLSGGAGDDVLSGGVGVDKIVGGTGADVIEGGDGNDQLWGGNWGADQCADRFVFKTGSGKDYVHDFEAAHDVIDLSAYDTDMNTVMASCSDLGWASVIDFRPLSDDQGENKAILLGVALADLDADNFIF